MNRTAVRSLGIRLLAVLFGTGLALGLAEIGVRIAGYEPFRAFSGRGDFSIARAAPA